MLNTIFIIICVFLNALCLWSIHILLRDKDNLTWKSYLKYFSGIPVGAGLSLLLFPITVQNWYDERRRRHEGRYLQQLPSFLHGQAKVG